MAIAFSTDALPSRFDFAEAQPRIYRSWEASGCFHAEVDHERRPFTVVIPPPNVTGALHLGHALNNTLQDVLVRLKRMQGFDTLWLPGTDHAGIATQAVVEKRLREEEGLTRHDLGREKLVARIWAWKDEYEARIISQLKRLGCSCDWQRIRFTFDAVCARAVRRTFFDLFRKRLIYRGKRLVNWDTFLQTAVSDDEVFHETVQGHFWHIRYPVIDPRPGEPEHVVVATTRPETMLGDTAVAVHPHPAAALAEAQRELEARIAAAPAKDRAALEGQLAEVQRRRSMMLPQLEQLREMARDGRQVLLPLLDRPLPLVADEWAKPELGSGCVKITPAHDPNDYEVGSRCRLPMINILLPDGTLNAHAGPYAGLSVADARQRVVADLQARGLLAEVEDREIDLAHSDRSKTPIEPYLADQWFVRMEHLAQSAMDAVTDGRVRIVPSRYAKSYLDWLSEKRDWPVSRQLWWGHQIPIWTYTCCDAAECRQREHELAARVAAEPDRLAFEVAQASSDTWSSGGGESAPAPVIRLCIAEEDSVLEREFTDSGFVREADVLDTWFSSALWPHSTLGWPELTPELEYFYPTSVLITSRDIITLWVARMVLAGLNNMGEVPFREVFIHPKILDGYGETMSKSKGNGVDPLDVIDKFGADALRFGLAYLTTETQDVRMPVQFECPHCGGLIDQTRDNRERPRIDCSKCGQPFSTQWARADADRQLPRGAVVSERFEVARNFANKLWNAARLVLINLEGYHAAPLADDELAFEDRWVLSRLTTVTLAVTQALESYQYSEAARTLYDFAWDEFCSFYLEMLKGRLQDPAARPVAQRLVAHVLDQLLRLLHPMMPFITEEIWQLLGRAAPERGLAVPERAPGMLVVASWPQAERRRQDPPIEQQFAQFQAVLGALREIRSRQNIAPRNEIAFSVRCDRTTESLLRPMTPFFRSLAKAEPAAWGPDARPPATHAAVRLGSVDVYVDLQGMIDLAAERERLEKQLQKLASAIAGKRRKLADEQFVTRAPPAVVQKERDSLVELDQQRAGVEESLRKLRAP